MMNEAQAVGCRLPAVGQKRFAFGIRPTAYRLPPSAFLQCGVTLIELVITIVIVAISVTAVLGVLSMLATGSADAMIRNQAVAIASAYLEEITLKPYSDPDGVAALEATRDLYDDVSDYNGLVDPSVLGGGVGARDQFGNAIAGLDQYTVTVTVGAGTLASIPGVDVRRIDVNVQYPSAHVNVTISGYRTNF